VVNKTGADLLEANYQCVKISGAQGQRPKVALAQANNDANSADTIGLVTETIANNQEGFVTDSGIVSKINTTGSLQGETWADGDVLYLSGTTAGRLTNVKPQAPIHTVIVGFVVYAHNNQGKIYVKVDNGYELNELHNVRINGVTDGQVLAYDSTLSVWENINQSAINAGTVTNGVYTTGDQTIGGTKTFSSTISGSVSGNAGTVTNGVYTTGNQTIAGIKIFSSSVDAPSFRDSANTAYYLDPANTSISMAVAGKVGVGTVSPSAMLTIFDGTVSTSDANSIAITSNYSTSTARRGGISWNDGTQAVSAISTVYNGTTVDMVFGSLYNSGYNTTERMRITGAGNVGIGTTSPSSLLQLNKASGASDMRFSVGGTLHAQTYASSSDYSMYAVSAIPMIFGTNNIERMRITSAGNVGIGTTSPGRRLSIAGGGFAFDDANTSSRSIHWGDGTNYPLVIQGDVPNGFISFNTQASGSAPPERMRIDSAGKVLIGAGATASLGKLVVSEASSGTAVIALESQGSWNSTIACTSTGNLVLRNNSASDRMLFDPYGNVFVNGTMYSPIYYDKDNSAFYLDANNTGTSLNVAGSIVAAGNVTAYSDIRVKDNVENITDAIDKLNQIRGVTYTRTDLDDKERKYAGVIAQEIEQVLPEAVFDNGKVKAVDYNATIALLIEAVKEQQGQINELKLTIEQLKGK
jgi:hypothetical protein